MLPHDDQMDGPLVQLLNQPAQMDEGYDLGPPPREVDAPERVEEQQSREDPGQAGDEPDDKPVNNDQRLRK